MRYLWLLVPVFLLFSGCGSAPKKYSKKIVKKDLYGKKLSKLGIRYYSGQDVLQLVKSSSRYYEFTAEVKMFILAMKLVKKEGQNYKLNTLDNLVYKIWQEKEKLTMSSVEYNEERKEYVLSGKYLFINESSYGKYNYTYHENVKFVVLFDKETKLLKGVYYDFERDKYARTVYLSPNGKVAWFANAQGGEILNLQTQTVISVPKAQGFITSDASKRFSKSGRYFAVETRDAKKNGDMTRAIYLFDSHKKKIVKEFKRTLPKSDISLFGLAFTFSEDERYFIYKNTLSNFIVYDLYKDKTVADFGKNTSLKENWLKLKGDKNYIFGMVRGRADKSEDDIEKLYIYDLDKKETFCTLDTLTGGIMFVDKTGLNIVRDWGAQEIYHFEKNNCFKIKKISGLKGLYTGAGKEIFSVGKTTYHFEKGKIEEVYKQKTYDISKADIKAIKQLQRVKKYFEAGFQEKGSKELRKLAVESEYDYFKKQYSRVTEFLTPSEEVYFDLLGFKRYLKNGQRDRHFERAARNYLFAVSRYGFKELLLPFIQEYKKAIGENPTKYQKDMLAIYMATYLLDIGKDKKAYEILFDSAPFHKKALWVVKRYSDWNMGLTKSKKKLAVAVGIDEESLEEVEKRVTSLEYLYDFNENRVKKGSVPKKIADKKVVKEEKLTPKQDAVKLLD